MHATSSAACMFYTTDIQLLAAPSGTWLVAVQHGSSCRRLSDHVHQAYLRCVWRKEAAWGCCCSCCGGVIVCQLEACTQAAAAHTRSISSSTEKHKQTRNSNAMLNVSQQ
eukprot:GHRQ01020600.1.p3 GENE.GHRQ01020600.1~~GHRQ01020600.1.p3  ORF type:complete len:110 (-),score=29.47 GHRQ01020600.1:528-857(-)